MLTDLAIEKLKDYIFTYRSISQFCNMSVNLSVHHSGSGRSVRVASLLLITFILF